MRLVSAYYQEFHPFDTFPIFKEFHATYDPDDLKEGDVLVVWGGADISPSLYGKRVSQRTNADAKPSHRDRIEWDLMQRAKELNIPIIGICRGAQMLCALAGGYLIQHVNGHGGAHQVITNTGERYSTNSLHHQMMMPAQAKHEVIAEIPFSELRSNEYWDEDRKVDHNQEPEFIYFNDVRGFAIQWHPEMMAADCTATQHIRRVFNEKGLE